MALCGGPNPNLAQKPGLLVREHPRRLYLGSRGRGRDRGQDDLPRRDGGDRSDAGSGETQTDRLFSTGADRKGGLFHRLSVKLFPIAGDRGEGFRVGGIACRRDVLQKGHHDPIELKIERRQRPPRLGSPRREELSQRGQRRRIDSFVLGIGVLRADDKSQSGGGYEPTLRIRLERFAIIRIIEPDRVAIGVAQKAQLGAGEPVRLTVVDLGKTFS